MIRDQRVAVVGAGKMGEALVRGLLDAGALTPDRIRVTTGSRPRPDRSSSQVMMIPPAPSLTTAGRS